MTLQLEYVDDALPDGLALEFLGDRDGLQKASLAAMLALHGHS